MEDNGGESCHTIEEPTEQAAGEPQSDAPVHPQENPHRPKRSWIVFAGIIAALSLFLIVASAVSYSLVGSSANSVYLADGATVYYNSACGDCTTYIQNDLIPTLNSLGIGSVTLKDWTNHVQYREELFRLHQQNGVDTSIMSHLTTFLKRSNLVIFEGHVPASLLSQVMSLNATSIPRMVVSVWDDGMTGMEPSQYAVWAYSGQPQVYEMSIPPSDYLIWLEGQNINPYTPQEPASMVPLVVAAGFIDGLNPCAFAVLLFFVSLLFATRAPAIDTVKMGSIYIYAIFVVYFMIGLGLLGAIVLSPDPHFMAKVGAVLMILVGGITIANYFLPKIPMPFHMPQKTWDTTRKWMKKATLPGALVAGVLVGLCTFPCSGTIYVFVLGLLAAKTSFVTGLGYLYLYNLFFILPLIIVLVAIMAVQYLTKRPAARGVARWERDHAREFRLMSGLIMIAMGVGFVLWAALVG